MPSYSPTFQTRGVVLTAEDVTLTDWPERAQRAGLTTIALHPFPGAVKEFVLSAPGQQFLDRCRELGLDVEYELHSIRELLPRALFTRNPDLFRMNAEGERTPDANLCVHSEQAMEIAAENATALSRILRPTTGRYFLWGDDAQPWCRCPRCRALTDSDQGLLLENYLLAALRQFDPNARLAHLAYHNTLKPPTHIRPAPGMFLEYAPIHRRYDIPYADQNDPAAPDSLEALDANLAVFGSEDAQALEYWLDASRFSRWKRPAVKLPWDPSVVAADLETYAARGLRHITSFAVYLDADYIAAYGDPPLEDYGKLLDGTSRSNIRK